MFQQMLFSKIVPNCKKLGLLDAADGWLRDRFTETGVIQFEDWVDTGEEYADLDAVAQDRAAQLTLLGTLSPLGAQRAENGGYQAGKPAGQLYSVHPVPTRPSSVV